MTTATAVRPLAPSEAIFGTPGTYIGYSVLVDGIVELDVLAAAFRSLQQTYPILCAVLEPGADGTKTIMAASGPPPEIIVQEGDPEDRIASVALDPAVSLGALHVTRCTTAAAITLLTHHSIADSSHSLALLAELCSRYTDRDGDTSAPTTAQPYPQPVEEILAVRGIEKETTVETDAVESISSDAAVELSAELAGWLEYRWDEVEPDFRADDVARVRLSPTDTTALIEFGRRHGVTVNGVLSAVIVQAEAEIRGVEPAEVRYGYPVDLRGRLTPPVAPTEGTNVIGYHGFVADAEHDLIESARAVSAQLRSVVDDGSIYQSPMRLADRARGARPSPPPVIATNWGIVPELRLPDELAPVDFRSVALTNRPAGAPELGGPDAQSSYMISTFGGRLSIELTTQDPAAPDAARRRITAVAASLLGLIADGGR